MASKLKFWNGDGSFMRNNNLPFWRSIRKKANIHAVLDEMQHKQFQSDERAAQSLVYRRAGKLGTARIAQELRRKGLDDSTIEQALDTLEGTELERAREVWQRKFSQPPATPQERAKQMRFLASRGFGGDVVRQVLRGSED